MTRITGDLPEFRTEDGTGSFPASVVDTSLPYMVTLISKDYRYVLCSMALVIRVRSVGLHGTPGEIRPSISCLISRDGCSP